MWVEILLTTVKISGVVLTTVFGAYGIKHEYKRDGVLTREGTIAIWGTLLSAVMSLSAQAIESTVQYLSDRDQRERYTEELKKWNEVLSEVDRGLYPVSDFHVSAKIRLPLSHPSLQPYAERLLREFKEREAGFDERGFYKGHWPNTRLSGWITSESQAYPQADREPAANAAVRGISLWFRFFKPPTDSSKLVRDSPDGQFRAQPDSSDPSKIVYDSECPGTVELDMRLTKVTDFQLKESLRFLRDFSDVEVLVKADQKKVLGQLGQWDLTTSEYQVKEIEISFDHKDHFMMGSFLRPLETDLSKTYLEYKLPHDMVHAVDVLPDTTPTAPRVKDLCPPGFRD
jgi:hypothetical protein